eukprot:6192002-Pleurochrysis_carterae.AAC.6
MNIARTAAGHGLQGDHLKAFCMVDRHCMVMIVLIFLHASELCASAKLVHTIITISVYRTDE